MIPVDPWFEIRDAFAVGDVDDEEEDAEGDGDGIRGLFTDICSDYSYASVSRSTCPKLIGR